MVGIAVRRRIDHVSDAIAWRHREKRVHRIEDLAGDDHVPLAQQTARVLSFLVLEHNVEAILPLFGVASVKFPERILEDIHAVHMNGEFLASNSIVESLQLNAEVTSLHVKVEDARVIDEHRERSIGQVRRRLSENLIQHNAMSLGELQELLLIGGERWRWRWRGLR
jgi:hypothetical protein